MILPLVAALIVSWVAGWVLIAILWRDQKPLRSTLLLRGVFAFGAGAVISSLVFCVSLVAFGPTLIPLLACDAAALLASMTTLALTARGRSRLAEQTATSGPFGRFSGIVQNK